VTNAVAVNRYNHRHSEGRMPDALDVHSVEILHKLGLTEDMVRDHVVAPTTWPTPSCTSSCTRREMAPTSSIRPRPGCCISSTSRGCVATSARC
jgi:hypothetical protein